MNVVDHECGMTIAFLVGQKAQGLLLGSSGAQVNVVDHECGMTIIMQQVWDQISFILVIMLETSQLDTLYFYNDA